MPVDPKGGAKGARRKKSSVAADPEKPAAGKAAGRRKSKALVDASGAESPEVVRHKRPLGRPAPAAESPAAEGFADDAVAEASPEKRARVAEAGRKAPREHGAAAPSPSRRAKKDAEKAQKAKRASAPASSTAGSADEPLPANRTAVFERLVQIIGKPAAAQPTDEATRAIDEVRHRAAPRARARVMSWHPPPRS